MIMNIRDDTQKECVDDFLSSSNHRATFCLCTGFGKSKIAIDIIDNLSKDKWILVTPTKLLRDENWLKEFTKWNKLNLYNNMDRICYNSLSKLSKYDKCNLILDEIHNLSEERYKLLRQFIDTGVVNKIVGLSATVNDDKKDIVNDIAPIIKTITIDEAIELGILPPYKIYIWQTYLSEIKDVKAGNKQKRFLTSRKEQYKYIDNQYNKTLSIIFNIINQFKVFGIDVKPFTKSDNIFKKIRFKKNSKLFQLYRSYAKQNERLYYYMRERTNMIYNSPEKQRLAKFIANNIIKDKRHIVFSGSIKQAKEMNKNNIHSKNEDNINSKVIEDFNNHIINSFSCVDAVNEGHNLNDIESCIIIQCKSKERDLIQRIGRTIRIKNGIAEIHIVLLDLTKDSKWLSDAIKSLNKDNIKIVEMNKKDEVPESTQVKRTCNNCGKTHDEVILEKICVQTDDGNIIDLDICKLCLLEYELLD